jgi:BASS family bile acid:Na+ symporter
MREGKVMNKTILILLALKASVFLNVFALGLDARYRDAIYLFRNLGRLARSLSSMFIVMPLFAAALAAAFDLHAAVKIALVALAVAPIPPLLPRKVMRAGEKSSYALGLLVAAALLSIVFTPLAFHLLGKTLGAHARMSPATIMQIVLLTVMLPLGAGMLVRNIAPGFAERWPSFIALAATVLLIASAVPILSTSWPTIEALIGNGTLAAITAFVLAGLAAGHILGGPAPEDRTAQALSAASRHPGIALAIASANFPEQKLMPAAILLYLIVSAVASIPYLTWRRRRRVESQGGAPAHRDLSRSR